MKKGLARETLGELERAVSANSSKEIYTALRADVVSQIAAGAFRDPRDYLAAASLVGKLQVMVDAAGAGDNTSRDKSLRAVQETLSLVSKSGFEPFIEGELFEEEEYNDDSNG